MDAVDQLAESLYETWLRDRGTNSRRPTAAEARQIKSALVSRARESAERSAMPLALCPTCQVRARGPHQPRK